MGELPSWDGEPTPAESWVALVATPDGDEETVQLTVKRGAMRCEVVGAFCKAMEQRQASPDTQRELRRAGRDALMNRPSECFTRDECRALLNEAQKAVHQIPRQEQTPAIAAGLAMYAGDMLLVLEHALEGQHWG